MRGNVIDAYTKIIENRLRVIASIQTEGGDVIKAFLPDREISVILPRSILLGEQKEASPEILQTIRPVVLRLVKDREVRLWQYKDKQYFAFLSWRSVSFGKN